MAFLFGQCPDSPGLRAQRISVRGASEVFRNLEGFVGRLQILFLAGFLLFLLKILLVVGRIHVRKADDFVLRCLYEFFQGSTFTIDSYFY